VKPVFATDLDRTVIFSKRFLDQYKPTSKYHIAETKDGNVISYISDTVSENLAELSNSVDIVPVTSRSIEEYKRVNLGFTPKYAIVTSGGTILKDGKLLDSYEQYIKDKLDTELLKNVAMDINCMYFVSRESKLVDGKYVFAKTDNPKECENEIIELMSKYSDVSFHIQGKKIYAIPNIFSKAVALRWLKHRNQYDKIVAMGDSELDINMLYIADYAVVPKHGELIERNIVQDGIISEAGIDSAMKAIDITRTLMNE